MSETRTEVEQAEGFVYVDLATGEQIAECPHCAQANAQVEMLERDLRAKRTKITKLERDAEARARKHKLWDQAEAVHCWWAIACNHPGVEFGAEEFNYVLPRLKREGLMEVLRAIAGAAFDPSKRPMANGKTKLYNDLELICRSSSKLRDFAERAPANWKRFLLTTIEANLT